MGEDNNALIVTIEWQKNTKEGNSEVIAFHRTDKGSAVVFPSAVEIEVPVAIRDIAMKRTIVPQPEDTEDCVLYMPEGKTVFFAFPAKVQIHEKHGYFFILGLDGEPDIVVEPHWPATVTVTREPNGSFAITVIPEPE